MGALEAGLAGGDKQYAIEFQSLRKWAERDAATVAQVEAQMGAREGDLKGLVTGEQLQQVKGGLEAEIDALRCQQRRETWSDMEQVEARMEGALEVGLKENRRQSWEYIECMNMKFEALQMEMQARDDLYRKVQALQEERQAWNGSGPR